MVQSESGETIRIISAGLATRRERKKYEEGYALELGLYAYDAYVLETARAERLPLLTLDGGLGQIVRHLSYSVKRQQPPF